jgi:hypothetical protein
VLLDRLLNGKVWEMKNNENTASSVKEKIHSKKFVSFSIGKEKYGIDVTSIWNNCCR